VRRPRRTQAERRAQTRAAVLEAANAVFVRRGFGAATLDEIADEAGYSKGALYYNFAGKEDLFLGLVEQRLDRRAAQLEGVVAAAAGGGADTAGRALAALPLDREWTVLFFEFVCHAARHPEVAVAFRERLAALRAQGAQALSDLAEATGRELPAPAERLATALSALANGMAIEALLAGDEEAARDLLAETAARLLR
jgi:AcrR family transcriptional regulator